MHVDAKQVFFNSSGSAIPIGSFSLGLFYTCYTICAVFFAPLISSLLGVKWGVFVGLIMYCYYIASLPVAGGVYVWTGSSAGIDFVLFTGAFIGGVGAGFLWTAEGAYFTQAAAEYAKLAGISKEKVLTLHRHTCDRIFLAIHTTRAAWA